MGIRHILGSAMGGLLLAGVIQPATGGQVERVEFAKDVLPILSENCFLCHGPDSGSRMAGLRLDVREGAVADRAGRPAIVPGRPDESLLLHRVTDADAPMPPATTGKSLTAAQKETLRRWIEQGADYERHWAFEPLPSSVAVPRLSSDWVSDEIDAFVLDRLNVEGLSPSRPARPERWLRRVTFDLTGLPPTLEDIDAFMQTGDKADAVDRLLASPAFGERMAVWWLDAARYADSYGYQSDLLATFWPYRDWVVSSFHRNLPYDQFLIEQVAGDLLPDASKDQVLATAFNRLHRMTNEGGSIAEEWKTEYAMDRTETFGTAFLGLTVGCARCHDHKYDPLTQEEYYKLYAYFNSIDEFGMLLSTEIVPTPSLLLPTEQQEASLEQARKQVTEAQAGLSVAKEQARSDFASWFAEERDKQAGWKPDVLLTFDRLLEGRIANEVDGKPIADLLQGAKRSAGRQGMGVSLSGDDGVAVRGLGSRDRWHPFTWSFWMSPPARSKNALVVLHRTGGTDVGFCGFDLVLEDGYLTARVMRHWPGNAVAVRTTERVSEGEWIHVGWTWDGSGEAAGLRLYLNGRQAATETLADSLWKRVHAYGDLGLGGNDWTFGARFRDLGLKNGELDDVAYVSRSASALEMSELFRSGALTTALQASASEVLLDHYVESVSPRVQTAKAALRQAQEQLAKKEDVVLEVSVMAEAKKPVPAHVLARGAYDAPKTPENKVSRGTPSFLPPAPSSAPMNRLGLAQWSVQPDHPLTSRVFVNRIWQMVFGIGLVETSENFGTLGAHPSHPELLDYLSRWFVDSGWDIKALVRKIVLSSTYGQDSLASADALARDPQNTLLARGPSHRLSAEMVRDAALAAAGLLDTRLGGPPVNPYQPTGLWTENNAFSPPFVQSKGQDLYRRSLYTTWKRTTPAPDMLAFDATGREVCVMRRPATSTPLQALVLLNHVQYVEAARVLAESLLVSRSNRRSQIETAFLLLAGRRPTDREASVLASLFEEQFTHYRADISAAIELASTGEKPRAEGLRASEVAALTVTVQAIMNSDATVWKR